MKEKKMAQPKVYVVVLTQFCAPAEHVLFFSREEAIAFAVKAMKAPRSRKYARVRGPVKPGQDIDKARSIKLDW